MTNKNKIKLFFLITKGNFGGAQRYVFDLVKNLPANKYDITVICGEGATLEHKLETATKAKISKLPSLKRDIGLISDLKTFWLLLTIFRRQRPDIIHLNSSKIGGLGALAGRLTGVPKIVFTGHGWAFNEKRSRWSKTIITLIHWLTILLTHTTIAVSETTAKQITHLPLVKNKVTVIHNGIEAFDLKTKAEARQIITNKLPAKVDSEARIWLGTVAELHPNKGLDVAIKAVAKLITKQPNFIYLIIGAGEERSKLEDLIAKLSLTDNVFLIGEIPDARTLLAAFDLFVFPSRTEALPYAALEAGLADRPIIASRVGGLPEIITDRYSGRLTPKEDPEALMQAIDDLLTRPDQATAYGQNLKSKVATDFSLSQMIKQTEATYSLGNPVSK